MICYHCKQDIDDDSLFCDQCGEAVYLCPDCRVPGRGEGKRCGKCGKPLVAAALLGQSQEAQRTQDVPNRQQHQSATSEQPGADSTSRRGGAMPTRLICREMGLTIILSEGLLLGRVEGPYAHMLSPLKYLSARHASILRDSKGWIIADEGSRNGTAVNGQWAYSPLHFGMGDTVRLANSYDFIAE